MKREKIDIGFWQETHLSVEEHEKLMKMGFRHTYYSSYGSGKKRGVAILIPNRIKFEFTSEIKDDDGRFILIKGKIDESEVTLLNVYAPPGSKLGFFKKVFYLISTRNPYLCRRFQSVVKSPFRLK